MTTTGAHYGPVNNFRALGQNSCFHSVTKHLVLPIVNMNVIGLWFKYTVGPCTDNLGKCPQFCVFLFLISLRYVEAETVVTQVTRVKDVGGEGKLN